MQNKYYYLVASLPYLEMGKELKINKEKFLYEAEKWLKEEDLETLKRATIQYDEPKEKENNVILQWREFDGELKKALAKIRQAKKNNSSEKTGIDEAKNIMNLETPLLMEQEFEKTRWSFLKNEEVKYRFDINELIIYYLKLQILERLGSFDKEEGEERFYKLCEVENE